MLSNSLTDLAHRVRTELDGIKRGALHAVTAGELLIEAKALVEHGQWEDWCKAAGLSPRTANHYMRLARHREAFKSANLADLTVSFALATLAPPPPEPGPKPEPRKANIRNQPPDGYREAKKWLEGRGHEFVGATRDFVFNELLGEESVGTFIDGAQMSTREVIKLAAMPESERKAKIANDRERSESRRIALSLVCYQMRRLHITIEELTAYFAKRRAAA